MIGIAREMDSYPWGYRIPCRLLADWMLLLLMIAYVPNLHAQNVVRDFRTHENAPAELRDVQFESKVHGGIWNFAWSTPQPTSIVFNGKDGEAFEKSDRLVLLIASKSSDSSVAHLAIRLDGSYRLELMRSDPHGNLVAHSDSQLPGLAIESEVRSDRLEFRGSIPLASLSILAPDGEAVRETDVLRLGLLRAQAAPAITAEHPLKTIEKRGIHWASWKSIPEENDTLFSTSCLGFFPLSEPKESMHVALTEGNRARQMRWAGEKTRKEFQSYCQSSLMQSKARVWFDQLQAFPAPVLEPIAFEWDRSRPTFENWQAASFFDQSLHFQFETLAMESTPTAPTALWEIINESGQTIGCKVRGEKLLIEWSDSTHATTTQLVCSGASHDHHPHEYSLVYPGTGDAHDIRVYCDGKPMMIQVVSNDMLDLTTSSSWCSKQKGNWRFKTTDAERRLQSFRIISNLPTAIEIRSMSSDEPWVTWEELPMDVRDDWVQHFVQKIDLEGMYLYESLLHYARGRMSSM